MKNLIVFLLIITASCGRLVDNNNAFNSRKLRGKYKVDLSPVISDIKKEEHFADKNNKLGKAFTGLAMSTIEVYLSFYDNNKGILELDGGLMDFLSALSDEPVEKIHKFTYKVEQDSVFYLKGEEDKEDFDLKAIVKRMGDNYDYLQFKIEDGEHSRVVNLSKVNN